MLSHRQEAGAHMGAAVVELRCERTPISIAGDEELQDLGCRWWIGYVQWGLASLHAGQGTFVAGGCFLNPFMPVVLPTCKKRLKRQG